MEILLLCAVGLPFIMSPVVYVVGKNNIRASYFLTSALSAAEMIYFAVIYALGISYSVNIGAFPMTVDISSDGFRSLYGLVTSFMWTVSTVFLPEYFKEYENKPRFLFFVTVTLGATLGVFLSKDLMTTFIFFELVSITSFVWVIHEETEDAVSAAKTYLAVAIFGGMVLLFGLTLLYKYTGTLKIGELADAAAGMDGGIKLASGVCILVGFAAKAGMFPLHIWLPKAHPAAPAPASALLSGVLTKVGVYGIIVISVLLFSGDVTFGAILMTLAVITLLLGAFLGLVSVNLKRTLACSSMSQIGFILTGVAAVCILGGECGLASSGVVLYMLNHSLMKLILFSAAGIIYMNMHTLDLNFLRGCGRGKPFLMIMFIIGGVGLAGIPGTGGYIAKTLLHEAVVECKHAFPVAGVYEWLFLIGGGCTLAYMTKLFVILFIEKNENDEKITKKTPYMNIVTRSAMLLSIIPVLITEIPSVSQYIAGRASFIAGGGDFAELELYGVECLSGAVYTITFGTVIYFLFVRKVTRKDGRYIDILSNVGDLETLVYRPLINLLTSSLGAVSMLLEKMLKPIFTSSLMALGSVSRLCGENMITKRIYTAVKTVIIFVSHILSDTLDAAVYMLRKTVFMPNDLKKKRKSDALYSIGSRAEAFASGVNDNFSYALIVTSVGVCIILLYLVVSMFILK